MLVGIQVIMMRDIIRPVVEWYRWCRLLTYIYWCWFSVAVAGWPQLAMLFYVDPG